jgi:hypothetical protein
MFDCIICTQTLQFIYDCKAAVATLHSMLKPKGVLLATFPGITKIDFCESNYSWNWTFTSVSAKRMFANVFLDANVGVRTFGNVLTGISFLHGVATQELSIDELDHEDPEYQVIIGVRAVKSGTDGQPIGTSQ